MRRPSRSSHPNCAPSCHPSSRKSQEECWRSDAARGHSPAASCRNSSRGIGSQRHLSRVEETLSDLLTAAADTTSDCRSLSHTPLVRFASQETQSCASLPGDRGPDSILLGSCSGSKTREAFIARCRTLLRDGGCLALTTFGPDNLQEIASVTGTGLSYLPLEWLHGLLTDAGLRAVLAEEEHLTLSFPSPSDVLRHLKHTGVTGITRTAWTPGRLARFSDEYLHRFGTPEGNVTLTYHPIYLIARCPIREHR